jgi:hypothetical protein
MTTLATDKPRDYELGNIEEYPVVAADIIYEGAAVGDNGSGYARPLSAGDPFRGFAEQNADNSGGSAGDVTVRVKKRGAVVLPISGLAITDVGKAVYASDDDTFTLTEGSNSYVGRVGRYIASGSGVVEFDAATPPGVHLTALTDSSGGTASDTIAAISSSPTQAEVANAIASLAAKVNSLIRAGK